MEEIRGNRIAAKVFTSRETSGFRPEHKASLHEFHHPNILLITSRPKTETRILPRAGSPNSTPDIHVAVNKGGIRRPLRRETAHKQ